MNEVSQPYKRAVYAPTRKTAANVRFEILDNAAYDDNTSSVTSEALISRKDQLTNKVRSMSHRYATFERDYFRLNGTFRIPPKQDESEDSELGWWSGEIADENGVFATPQVLEFTFSEEHHSMGLTITFDTMAREYASDFQISVYGNDGLIYERNVTNNQNAVFVLIQGLDYYTRIVLTITKWAKPYRRVRVTEVDFGVIKIYEGDKLIKVNLIEQMNIVGDTLPANEVRFTIDNSDREFNILNPLGFYRFLKERQEVSLSIGVEIAEEEFEYINYLKYYLTEWQSDEGALTTTFTARNIFELLEQKEYAVSATGSLYDIALDIITLAEIEDYFIDEALQDIPTTGFKDKITYRKALQCIGIAGKCAVYQDRDGVLQIRRFELLDEQTTFFVYAGYDTFTGMTYPQVDNGYDMKNINFDNVYKEPQIKLDKLVHTLTMVVHDGEESEEITFVNEGIKEGASLKCDNPLIQSVELAEDVAKWILEESNLRAVYNINWRQNPCLETGDIVIVEDSFGAKKQSRITKQEYEFGGYLTGKTETKGGV